MSFIASIQSLLPRPENRSHDQIARDLEDEFAFHLEMKTRAIEAEEGLEGPAARRLAHERFGDIERIRRECQRIALKERIMLQRVNFIMMLVVMLMIIAVGVQVFITQRHNTLALQAITAEMTNMKYDALAKGRGSERETSATGPTPGEMSDARILVEGDVAAPGWYPLDMQKLTYVDDVLRTAGARGEQWAFHRRAGGSAQTRLASDYLDASDRVVLRPGDELAIRNEISREQRLGYYMRRLADEAPTYWTTTDRDGNAWHLAIRTVARGPTSVDLLREGGQNMWSLALTSNGATIFAPNRDGANPTVGWDVREGALVIDFTDRRQPTQQVQVPARAGSGQAIAQRVPIHEALVFRRTESGEAFAVHHRLAERARVIGEFVVDLFTHVRPSDLNMRQTIIDWLDRHERALDDTVDDPVTAAMIRELIAARRKILEADELAIDLQNAEARVRALSDFIGQVLTAAEPALGDITARNVLENANEQLEARGMPPDVKAQMREAIDKALQDLAAGDAGSASPDTQPAVTQPQENGADDGDDEPEPEPEPDEQARFELTSPFWAVKWKDQWTPIVLYQGTWYELVAIDGTSGRAIVDHARRRHGEQQARQRFSEDLAQLMIDMGAAAQANLAGDVPAAGAATPAGGAMVTLQLKDLRSGTVLAVNEARMTGSNRERVRQANREAEEAGAAYPAWE